MPFKCLVREKCGLSFDDSREAILAEGIKSRLLQRALASHEEYLDLLTREQHEFDMLVNLITVNETYFLREPVHFTILTEKLIPDMMTGRTGGRIKIVCAGCSTGEEPYSIAMTLMAKFGPGFHSMFSVVGIDIDDEALSRARAGVYAGHSFRGVPDHIRKGFFDKQGNSYRIRDAVREGVEFLRLNIFGDSYPDSVRDADVIFYRNVSIYFEPEAQQRVFRNLAGLLSEKGYLFLSSTETFAHNIGVLSLVEKEGDFIYSKRVEVRIVERRKPSVSVNKAAAPATQGKRPAETSAVVENFMALRKKDEPHQIFDQALALAEAKKYDVALQLTESVIKLQPSFIKAYMLQAGILLNLEKFDEAEAVCRCGMELDQWCLEGKLLLGLLAKVRSDFGEARMRFKEALYINSASWVAHFYLGEIYRYEEDEERACREFRIVLKLLEEKGSSEHALTFLSFAFPVEQIVHLCRHNLVVMKGPGRGMGS
ncbi:MAG: CheR family methyltransferase [Thermodesulfovibrionales bacterium]